MFSFIFHSHKNSKRINWFINPQGSIRVYKLVMLLIFIGIFNGSLAQEKMITGVVKGPDNTPLPGVNIVIKDSSIGTQTDFDGKFTIKAAPESILKFSFVGFKTREITVRENTTTLQVNLQEDIGELEEVVVLGSRSRPRTITESPVPVDVFKVEETSLVMPQSNINQMLNAIAPSFTSTVQTAADGTDHIDPAQLRGMGPDQVLVLLNGKRRHTTALVNVNGSPGKGTVGTDLNAIPSFALDHIEILRDGASAQYGSDAISGVMDLELREDLGFSGRINFGGNLTSAAKDHTKNWDGSSLQAAVNYGAKLGKKGGFINATLSFHHRQPTSRAGMRDGEIYNAFNAIQNRALEQGEDLNANFSNIKLVQGTAATNLVHKIQQYTQEVDYFSNAMSNKIQGATSISELQSVLGADVTPHELEHRHKERRDFNMRVGQSELTNTQLFINAEIPLNEDWKFYTFGGYSYRDGKSGGFYRLPNASNNYTSLYPDGYLPNIKTHIQDFSIAAGIKGKLGKWNLDLSNTFGENRFDYIITNSINMSLRSNSPSRFKAGGPQFWENTINIDLNRNFAIFKNFNLAFGAEQRHENFTLHAGEPQSFLSYDIDGNPIESDIPDHEKPTDFFGNILAGGSQVYGGFRADNAVDKARDSYSAYADAAIDFTSSLLLDAAVRYEHYSDFGSTINFKLATRVKLTDNFNWRGAASTGFRAPSIHQIYFNQSSTYYVDGQIMKVGTFSNDSKIANLVGIPDLKEEKSVSLSTGFTYKIPAADLTFTLDGYFIKVKDRIQLTGRFEPTDSDHPSSAQQALNEAFTNAGVEGAQFFANAIDTETKGLDLVISHHYNNPTGHFSLNNDFALDLNQTRKVGNIHSSDLLHKAGLDQTYFDESARILLEEAVPRIKATLSHRASLHKFNFYLRNTLYGEVTDYNILPNTDNGHQTLSSKVITDLSFAYRFTAPLSLTIGANNLFDLYPTKNTESLSYGDQFIYNRAASQFGLNGRYVFAKLSIDF